MKTVSKSKLKARMLEYFREVERTGESLVVTDQGREVLEVRPLAKREVVTVEDGLARHRAGPGKARAHVLEAVPQAPEWKSEEAARRPQRNNLDKYAGDSDFGPEWDEFLEKDLKQLDGSLWS